MRKTLLLLLTLALLLLCGTACAETFTFDAIYATCTVEDDNIILTPTNLSQHPEWIASLGTTEEALAADFAARGVLVQAWSTSGDRCIEITAIQDARALEYWDINEVGESERFTYRTSHSSNVWYQDEGYTYSAATWKRTDSGRFLQTEYKRMVNGETVRGFQRRTVRNGYTITIDCIAYGRRMQTADSNAINRIMNSWVFTQVISKPADTSGMVPAGGASAVAAGTDSNAGSDAVSQGAVSSNLSFTSEPPEETNTGKFIVTGTATPGTQVVGVLMRLSNPTPTRVEATASSKTGKFTLDVALDTEGVWLMTVSTFVNGQEADSYVFERTITYSESMLIVNFDEPIPTELTGDKLIISGKTLSGVSIQCLAGGSFDKSVKTNNNGVFKFTIDTSAEGTYDIVLSFQKKNYATRRFAVTATRTLTEEDIRNRARDEAVKPAYSTLVAKLTGYTGRTLTYSMYVTDIMQAGNEWIIFMAMNHSNKNGYSNIVVVTTDAEPNLEIGSEHRLYGTCVGTYEVQSEGETKFYPCIDLLFWDD